MSEKIVVPVLGESITEATVAKWLKIPGDAVEADEPIVELETDKVNLEVPSPISGVLTEINSQDGSVVEVGALLGSVSADSGAVKSTPIKKKQITPKESNVIKLDASKKEPKIFEEKEINKSKEKPLVLTEEFKTEVATKRDDNPTLSPAVRK
jgi:Pyruvate/2-oxoglutarate dehydrogenase complex, dihydrolipoamide acyltransferase (E2) component, and related enzymes